MSKTELRTIVAEIEGLGLGLGEGRRKSYLRVIQIEVQHLHVNLLRLLHIEMSLTAVQAISTGPESAVNCLENWSDGCVREHQV